MINARRECNKHSPRASLGRSTLPWAPTTIFHTAAAVPEYDDLEYDSVCAKGVDGGTSPGNGTSGTARIQNAGAKFAVGRLRGGRRSGGGTRPRKPSTPRRSGRAAAKRGLSLKRPRRRRLRRRVVTQLGFFSGDLCHRPGCFESPVSSARNPGCYCCAACRQAVRNVEDRERKWLSRGKLTGRLKRTFEYQAARRKRVRDADVGSGPGPPAPPRP